MSLRCYPGDAAQVGRNTPTSELDLALAPVTSQLEGVSSHRTAYAASLLVHVHTTSFHCAYCTLPAQEMSSFSENSLTARKRY